MDNTADATLSGKPAAALVGNGDTARVSKEATTTVKQSGTATGQAKASVAPIAETAPLPAAGSPSYKIGALDILDISVYKVPDLARTVQVAENGAINLPLVGETMVAGMTAQEIERDLAKRLGDKYLQKPQVSVSVKEFVSQRLTVEGAVKTPGVYPLKGKTNLLQIVALSGGLTEVAENEVTVVRFAKGKRSAAKFDLDDVRSGKIEDPALLSGDVVIVGISASKTAFNNLLKVVPLTSVFRVL